MIGPTWLLGAQAILYKDGVLYRIPSGTGDPVELVIGGGGTETDPVFSASPAASITTTQKTNWDTAYSWGNHAAAGYLTAEADTLNSVTTRGNSTANAITVGGLNVDAGTLYVDAVNNRVGINTTAPNSPFHVVGQSFFNAPGAETTFNTTIKFAAGPTSARIATIGASSTTGLVFTTNNNAYSFTFTHSTGNFLIGTTTDAGYKLDVNGTGRFTSTLTANSFVKSGGTSGQFLKADGSIDSNVYLTTLTDTLATVTSRGNTTTNAITVGGLTILDGSVSITKLTAGSTLTLTPNASDNAIVVNNGGYMKWGTVSYIRGFSGATLFAVYNSSYTNIFNIGTSAACYVNTGTNFLIGATTDAGYKLYVNGNIGLSGNLVPTSGTSTVGTFANRFTDFWGSGLIVGTTFYGDNLQSASGTLYFKDGGGVEKMRMDSSGSFMINGTSRTYGASSGYMFGVKGTASQALLSIARSTQTLDSQGMVIGLDASVGYIILRDNIGLAIYTNDTERLRIHGDGNVSVGTISNAGYKLQVIGNTSFSSGTDTYHYITSTATGSAGTIYTNTYHSFFTGTNYATANSWEVYDLTSSASRIWISGPTGNVGINRASATYKLDVQGDIRSTSYAYFATAGGSVGIGTTTPGYTLDVVGYVNASVSYYVGGVSGWTGTIFIASNPPGQQNIQVIGGIITNVS
jgi:hypothetical protein